VIGFQEKVSKQLYSKFSYVLVLLSDKLLFIFFINIFVKLHFSAFEVIRIGT